MKTLIEFCIVLVITLLTFGIASYTSFKFSNNLFIILFISFTVSFITSIIATEIIINLKYINHD